MTGGAQVTELPGGKGFRVTCPAHHMDRLVETGTHAANLQALHDRMDHIAHPPEINLTSAASMVIAAVDVGGTVAEAALAVWAALLEEQDPAEALSYAQDLHTVGEDIRAAVIPF